MLESFWFLAAYALPMAVIFHMAATVIGATQRPLLTSRALLIQPILFVLLTRALTLSQAA